MRQVAERKLTRAEFAFVEQKLFNYHISKALIAEYEFQRDALLNRGPEHDGQPRGNKISKPTEITAVQLAMLEEKARNQMFWVKAIEDTLKCLTEEERELVELKYFEGYLTNEGIMLKMAMNKNRFYRLREAVVTKFARRMAII